MIASGERVHLVHQVSDWCSGAAASFWLDARSEEGEYPLWSFADCDKAAGQKARSPEGCDENGPAATLLLSHLSKLRVSSSAKKKSDKNGGIGLFLERDYRVLVSLLFPPNRGFGGSAPIFDRLPFSRTFKND